VPIGDGQHVDIQLEREIVTTDPRMYRRVKRRKVVHTDYFVDQVPPQWQPQPQLRLRTLTAVRRGAQGRMNILLAGPAGALDDYEPCTNIPVSVVGRYIRAVEPRDKRCATLLLVIVVSCERGRMVVSCESTLRVKNFSNLDLDVLSWLDGKLTHAGVVEAQGSLPVPVLLANSSDVRIRPANSTMTSSPLMITTGAYHQIVRCKRPGSSDVDTLALDTEVFAEAELIPDRFADDHVEALQLCVYPPLTLCNHLPADIHYAIRDKVDGIGKVVAGDSAQIFCVAGRELVSVAMELSVFPTPGEPSECWLGSAVVSYDRKKPGQIMDVELRSTDGRRLTVHMEFTDRRTVVVYAGCWVQNRTGVPLRYRCQGQPRDYWSDGGAGKDTTEGKAQLCIVPLTLSDNKLAVSTADEATYSRNVDTSRLDAQLLTVRTASGRTLAFWVQIDTAPGALAKTKLVTITPYHVIANNLPGHVVVRQLNATSQVVVPAGGVPVAFHPQSAAPAGFDGTTTVRVQMSRTGAGGTGGEAWCLPLDISTLEEKTSNKTTRVLGGATDPIEVPVEVRFGAAEAYRLLVIGGEPAEILHSKAGVRPSRRHGDRGSGGSGESESDHDSPASEEPGRPINLKVKFPGFDLTFRDLNDFAMRHVNYDAAEHAIHKDFLRDEFLTVSVGNLYLHTLSTDDSTKLHAQISHIQIRDKCNCAPERANDVVFRAGGQGAESGTNNANKAIFVEAEQKNHPSLLVLDYLKLTLPDTINVNMNDTWVLVARAVLNHVYAYLGPGEAPTPAQLMAPMRSHLARVEASVSTVYVRELTLSDILARVSFERTSGFSFPVPMLPQWLKFAIQDVAVDLEQATLTHIFGSWSTVGNMLFQNVWPQLKRMGMDIVVNRRWKVLNFKDWAGRKTGKSGHEFADIPRMMLNMVSGAPSKSVSEATMTHGFKEQALSNEHIVDKHWKGFRKCVTQKKFDEQLDHLIFDWDSNHCGLEARHCVAIAVVNRAADRIDFDRFELRRGTEVRYMQKALQPMPSGLSRHAWHPAQTNVVFGWGNAAGGGFELLLDCTAFSGRFTDDAGAELEPGTSEGSAALTASFVAVNTHKWWSKYVIVISNNMQRDAPAAADAMAPFSPSDGPDEALTALATRTTPQKKRLLSATGTSSFASPRPAPVVPDADDHSFAFGGGRALGFGLESEPTVEPDSELVVGTELAPAFEPAVQAMVEQQRLSVLMLPDSVPAAELAERKVAREATAIPALYAAAEARSRSTLVQLHNTTGYRLQLQPERVVVGGTWTVEPPVEVLPSEVDVAFGSESRGFFTVNLRQITPLCDR
jgi:hypothetical protein